MKKIISLVLAVMMLASVLAVPAFARGYTLSIPKTFSAHNMDAYGLHTMNAFYTDYAPDIDGEIAVGEYPGPNNGCVSSTTYGNGFWTALHSNGSVGAYSGSFDGRDYVDPQDLPDYINTYLTYDDNFLYIGVTALIQPQTVESTLIDTRVSFIQSENPVENPSRAWNRYSINHSKGANLANPAITAYIYTTNGTSGSTSARRIIAMQDGKKVTQDLPTWIDTDGVVSDPGTSWNAATYQKAENTAIKMAKTESGKWTVCFECRQPLADIMRVTDVEYEDGTPLEYVPEWGTCGIIFRLNATKETTNLALGERFFAQTMLPAAGNGYTGANSEISGLTFNNTLSAAVNTAFGGTIDYLRAPVHFLGIYDPEVDYDDVYALAQNTIVKTTTRVTRTIGPRLTSGVRGVNGRVIGVATTASDRTGDNLTVTLIVAGVMVLCAASGVVILFMKKRSSGKL